MRLFRYEKVHGLAHGEVDLLVDRFRAFDAEGRAITLLRLRPEYASDGVTAAWLEQCGRNHALSVQGVLRLFDFGMHAGAAYASLERAEDAVSLAQVLDLLHARGESASPMLAVHIALELCVTLARAHQLAIDGARTPLYHGDLCAERVLVHADGRLSLAELGLLRALPPEHAVRLCASAGRAEHLAPELARGMPIDAQCDVFALGALIRRLVVPAHAPLVGSGTRRIDPGPSPELSAVLRTLLAPSRDERVGSALEARSALATLPRHLAGAAALAQLHADLSLAPPRMLPSGEELPLALTTAGTRSFAAPSAVPSAREGARLPVAASGFPGRATIGGGRPRARGAASSSAPPPEALAPGSRPPPASERERPPPDGVDPRSAASTSEHSVGPREAPAPDGGVAILARQPSRAYAPSEPSAHAPGCPDALARSSAAPEWVALSLAKPGPDGRRPIVREPVSLKLRFVLAMAIAMLATVALYLLTRLLP